LVAVGDVPLTFARWRGWRYLAAVVVMAVLAGSLLTIGTTTASAATVDTSAWYVLVNRNSGKAIEVQNASTADGGNIVQYTDWNGANQQWQLIRIG
jgi:hypothetical protein